MMKYDLLEVTMLQQVSKRLLLLLLVTTLNPAKISMRMTNYFIIKKLEYNASTSNTHYLTERLNIGFSQLQK